MFGYIFQQIWNNKIIRYGLLALILIVMTSFFIKIKFSVYNFVQKLFESPEFDNPLSYKGRLYGFEENPEIAIRHYRQALLDLTETAFSAYDHELPDNAIDANINLQLEWEKHLSKEALIVVYQLLDDVHLYCMPLKSIENASKIWQREERLNNRRLKKQDPLNPSPFDYAVTDEDFQNFIKLFLDIDYSYLYPAIQKKPDSWAIITLHERLLESACKTYLGIQWWQKALTYFEYKEEKKIYEQFKKDSPKGEFAMIAETLTMKVFEALKNNSRYHDYLREFYLRNRSSTEDLTQKMNLARSNFILTNKRSYLIDFIRFKRQQVMTASQAEAKKIFDELLNQVQFTNIETEAEYLLALASAALRGGDSNQALANINRLLHETVTLDKALLTEAYRLQLVVELKLK